MGYAVNGVGVGLLPSSLRFGCHHGDGVSVLTDKGGQSGRVSGQIVSSLAVSVGALNISGVNT